MDKQVTTEISNTSVPAIFSSMALVQEELKSIGKDQQGFGYKFRGIDQVLNALNPLFKKHKILTLRRNLVSNRSTRKVADKNGREKEYVEVTMTADYVFKSLVDGSEIVSVGFGEGQDTSGGDKASSMATSNSYKYVIFEMFNIATEEQKDSDQVTAEQASKETVVKTVTKDQSASPPAGLRKFKRSEQVATSVAAESSSHDI